MHRSHPATTPDPGFSLVELLVAALLMAISSLGGAYLFTQATQQATAMRRSLEQQFVIGNELAAIRDRNDRYSCINLPCSVQLGGDPPNQNNYAPADPDDTTHTPNFRQLCQSGLADGLIAHINTQAPKLTDSGVIRQASTDLTSTASPVSTPPHRYLVRWSTTNGRVLRQVQLIPTVAAWCP